MLTIKPGLSQLQEPDPAFQQTDLARIIFLDDEPQQPVTDDDNKEVQPYQMAKRTQGSESGKYDRGAMEPTAQNDVQDDDDNQEKDTHLDTSNKALTDEFKKGLKDQTTLKEQLLADNSVQEKVSAMEALKEAVTPTQVPIKSEVIVENFNEDIAPEEIIESQPTHEATADMATEKPQKMIDAIEQFNRLMQERKTQPKKQPEQTAVAPSKNIATEPAQKIESKKHRPIDIGLQNQSKLELTKDVSENHAPKKRKLSLQDLNLQQGFSDFVRQGNANFSADGNSDKDDENGLKIKSYMTQIGKMHENACKSYPEKIIIKHQDQVPPQDSIINMIIERSGKVNLVRLQSSGNQSYDDYHMKILIFMGNFPPIPKFISDTKDSFPVKSVFYTATSLSSFGSYQPRKLEL